VPSKRNEVCSAFVDERFQWEMPFFRVFQLRNPWTDFQNILHSWLRRWPHPTRRYLDQSVQRGRVCTCVKLSSSGIYFLGFFLVSCASLQVRPFDLQIATSKRHNSGTVKDTCKMFAPNWGFWGSGNQMVLFKFLLDPPSLPWQQADVIWTQNRPLLSLSRLVR